MRHMLLQTIAGATLLVFGMTTGMAQEPNWYQQRHDFFQGDQWKAHLFQRVRDDLDRVQTNSFPGRDEFRITRTKDVLGDLQNKMAEGRYDQPQLDEVISGVQRIVNSNRLSDQDRTMLVDDLARLRDYRAHHENWPH